VEKGGGGSELVEPNNGEKKGINDSVSVKEESQRYSVGDS